MCAAPLEINDGTPLGVRVQEAIMAAVLIGPTTKTNKHIQINKSLNRHFLEKLNSGYSINGLLRLSALLARVRHWNQRSVSPYSLLSLKIDYSIWRFVLYTKCS
jgi:hypothetical protein